VTTTFPKKHPRASDLVGKSTGMLVIGPLHDGSSDANLLAVLSEADSRDWSVLSLVPMAVVA
jgi:hypothetical protein